MHLGRPGPRDPGRPRRGRAAAGRCGFDLVELCCIWAGLDHAILGGLGADERRLDGARIAALLAHGAHALGAPEDEAGREGEAFEAEVRLVAVLPCAVLFRLLRARAVRARGRGRPRGRGLRGRAAARPVAAHAPCLLILLAWARREA